MKKETLKPNLLASTFLATMLALGTTSTALAQEAPAQESESEEDIILEKVTVTGSRIVQTNQFNSVGPVNVLSADIISTSGKTNLGELLQELPSVAFLGDGSNVNNGSDGVTTVNLRGLGTERILVLMNGRRISPAGTGINNLVDLSIFPVAMIDRIEVLKDGAAAIYGADAVAGVINIITKKDFEGVEVTGRAGSSTRNDAELVSGGATFGVSSDKGSTLVGLNYYTEGGVLQSERDVSACPYLEPAWGQLVVNAYGLDQSGTSVCSGSSFIPTGRFYTSNGSRTIGPNGDQPFDFFVDYYNFNPLNYLRTPSSSFSSVVTSQYEILPGLNVEAELMFSKRTSDQDLAPVPMGNGAQQTYGLTIPSTNPFNIYGEDLAYRKRMLDVGPRLFSQESDTIRILGSIDGTIKGIDSLPFFGGASWDAFYSYDRNNGTDTNGNLIDMFRVQQALDTEVTTNGGAGTVTVGGVNYQCADSLARNLGCEPLNLFGANSITPGAAEYIRLNTVDNFYTQGKMFAATISNNLFEIPSGTVGAVIGIEARELSGGRNIDAAIENGYSSGNPALSTSGTVETTDYFAEIDIPLFGDLKLANAVTLNLAGRYSEYNLFEGNETYRASVRWEVNDQISLRGTVSNSQRAPSLSDLFNGGAGGFPTYGDPCASVNADTVASTTAAGICASEGVAPGTFATSNAQLLSYSVGAAIVGNNLQPENGETKTAGIVIEPTFGGLDKYNIRFAADYYSVEVTEAIQLEGLQGIINDCYEDGVAAQCAKITRQTGGDILRVDRAYENGTDLETAEGVDIALTSRFDIFENSNLLAGELGLSVQGTQILSREDTDDDGNTADFKDRCLGFTAACFNELRVNTDISYETEKLRINWGMRYLSGINGDEDDARTLLADDFGYDNETVDSLIGGYVIPEYLYHDVNLRFSATDTFSLTLGIDNVLDKEPPFVKYVDGFFDPTENTPVGTYDTRGRFIYLQLDKSF